MSKLDVAPTGHVAVVGSRTGAVTIEAAPRTGRVTALERKPDRLAVTRRYLEATDTTAEIDLRQTDAPIPQPLSWPHT